MSCSTDQSLVSLLLPHLVIVSYGESVVVGDHVVVDGQDGLGI